MNWIVSRESPSVLAAESSRVLVPAGQRGGERRRLTLEDVALGAQIPEHGLALRNVHVEGRAGAGEEAALVERVVGPRVVVH